MFNIGGCNGIQQQMKFANLQLKSSFRHNKAFLTPPHQSDLSLRALTV